MKYFEISNASKSVQIGTARYKAEPVILQSGSWIGVLALQDNEVSTKDFLEHPRVKRELTETEYADLKKKREEFWKPSEIEAPQEPVAAPAEKEKPEPKRVEEVLMEGKAIVKDPLSDEAKPKRKKVKPTNYSVNTSQGKKK